MFMEISPTPTRVQGRLIPISELVPPATTARAQPLAPHPARRPLPPSPAPAANRHLWQPECPATPTGRPSETPAHPSVAAGCSPTSALPCASPAPPPDTVPAALLHRRRPPLPAVRRRPSSPAILHHPPTSAAAN
ncbi:hypothetical protein GUJ93_ZPchr0002g23039 [Zizania palustris]|uniref:Uncharacterized protein n=1 Tax=Zizania palustris TaxID=103762 RepID=A0A8J5RJE1_ZIZPA|nr:hypothetical protein GUJ93_ZPchr0002g23039 [Zizania palustris]